MSPVRLAAPRPPIVGTEAPRIAPAPKHDISHMVASHMQADIVFDEVGDCGLISGLDCRACTMISFGTTAETDLAFGSRVASSALRAAITLADAIRITLRIAPLFRAVHPDATGVSPITVFFGTQPLKSTAKTATSCLLVNRYDRRNRASDSQTSTGDQRNNERNKPSQTRAEVRSR